MFKKFSILLLGFVASTFSLNQVHQSLTNIQKSNFLLEEVEIDTSNFIIEDDLMISSPGSAKIKLEQYTVNVGKVNPLKFNYISRLGDGLNFVQVMDTKVVEKFNPFAILNFSNEKTQISVTENIDKEKVQSEAAGLSEVKVTRNVDNWANVKIFTAVHFWNELKWISNSDEEVEGDTIFIFSILSVIDSTILAPNIVEIRGSFGQKVKFYE